jgi:hypothetical protein
MKTNFYLISVTFVASVAAQLDRAITAFTAKKNEIIARAAALRTEFTTAVASRFNRETSILWEKPAPEPLRVAVLDLEGALEIDLDPRVRPE